jgi:uncharacterized protein (DUF885 family)
MLAAGMVLAGPARALATTGATHCPAPTDGLDSVTAPILSLLPDAAVTAGLLEASAGGPAARRCDDWSPEGRAALGLAVAGARAMIPAEGCDAPAATVRAQLDAAMASADIAYGRNDPLAAIHLPYLATAFTGPHVSTPASMRLVQDVATPAAIDAWQARLSAYATTLLGVAEALRADESAGCVPPAAISRAALPQMDAFLLVPAGRHPLVAALGARITDPDQRAEAGRLAALAIERHVQPAMAMLRDTTAALTRRGRPEIGLWAQKDGESLHAANVARAGDTRMSLTDAQALGRSEVARIASLLDRRLTLRGLHKGSLADRVAAAFAAHPEFIESDDEGGRASLLQSAQARIDAAKAVLPHLVPAGDMAPLDLRPLPDAGLQTIGGSFYMPAAIDGSRGAALWLDTRSVHALPAPGVAPLAYHLGLPGLHLQASRAAADRPLFARMGAWPAINAGWACYAERLAAEQGLFARDPWGDIARLSDELLRAARMVTDIGIHAQRWTREQAEAEMTQMTGAPQGGSIDRIMALPGEAASPTLGLQRMLALRDRARTAASRHFDLHGFHATVLDAGPRPFAMVEATLA